MTSKGKKQVMMVEIDDWRLTVNYLFLFLFDRNLMKRKGKEKTKSHSHTCLIIIRLFSGVYMRGNISIWYTINILQKLKWAFFYNNWPYLLFFVFIASEFMTKYKYAFVLCQQFHPINLISQSTQHRIDIKIHVNFSRECSLRICWLSCHKNAM